MRSLHKDISGRVAVHKIYWEMARGLIKMQWKGAQAIDRARAR